jgi:hypothetical protein
MMPSGIHILFPSGPMHATGIARTSQDRQSMDHSADASIFVLFLVGSSVACRHVVCV